MQRKCQNITQCLHCIINLLWCSPEATVTLVPVWKQGILNWGILESFISLVLKFKSHIKLIYNSRLNGILTYINEFNPTFEIQKMGNEAFQNISFGNASFPYGNEDNIVFLGLFRLTFQNYLMVKDLIASSKNWLMRHFSHSIFNTEIGFGVNYDF